MGRWIYWGNGDIDDHKFWFGTQSSHDITDLGGEEMEQNQIEWCWTWENDYKPLCKQIRGLKAHLKSKWGVTFTEAMKRQDPEWCRGDESKGATENMWRVVAKIDLALKVKKGLEFEFKDCGEDAELYCTADYY